MRYLLIVENPGYTVKNRPHLLKELRAHLPVIALRIATRHIEVDVKGADPQEARKIVERILGGSVVEVVDITFEEVKGGVEDYVRLFNQERFWEAHNALEGLWRSTRNPTLQGLIMPSLPLPSALWHSSSSLATSRIFTPVVPMASTRTYLGCNVYIFSTHLRL